MKMQAEGERWPPRRRNDGLGRRRTQEEKEGTVSLPPPLCSFLLSVHSQTRSHSDSHSDFLQLRLCHSQVH